VMVWKENMSPLQEAETQLTANCHQLSLYGTLCVSCMVEAGGEPRGGIVLNVCDTGATVLCVHSSLHKVSW
jgi:hypothetical protein